MNRRKMPDKPWVDIAIDFLGPLPDGNSILGIVDYFSRHLELEIMQKVTAQGTIAALEPHFVRFGYPVTITLDNGSQFISREFEDYCKERNIELNHTTPYFPQENGEIERQNRSIVKRLKIANVERKDWKEEMNKFLLAYRTTPHNTTGKTPSELMYGFTIRSKIPSIRDIEQAVPKITEAQDRDATKKLQGKENEDAKRRAKASEIEIGDTVVSKEFGPKNKLSTTFQNSDNTVIEKTGNRATIQNNDTGKVYQRSTTHLKKIPQQSTVSNPLISDFGSSLLESPEPSQEVSMSSPSTPIAVSTPLADKQVPPSIQSNWKPSEAVTRYGRLSKIPPKFKE